MMKSLKILGYDNTSEYMQNILGALLSYREMFVNEDGSGTYKSVEDAYFLENDKWHIDFIGNIEQFKNQYEEYKYTNKTISFNFNSNNINNEMKFIVFNTLFSDE